MTHRVRRQLITSTFNINDQLCKVFLEPWFKSELGFWVWNVGFAVGKSNRQLNDWYKRKKNKRRRSLHKHLTGYQGMHTISQGFKEVLRLRWQIEPGDTLVIDCTSADPDRQFKVWKYFCRKRKEWLVDEEKKEFYWTRPPYPSDQHWKLGTIIPQCPQNLLDPVTDNNYFDCFYLSTRNTDQSIH